MPITVTPLDAPLGAEISGLDVHDIPPDDAQALHQAFLGFTLLSNPNHATREPVSRATRAETSSPR